MPITRDIKYTSRDFEGLVGELTNYIKLYFPDSYGDFSPASVGQMLMEIAAFVGDNVNYYQDRQYNEIMNPSELKNAIKLLKMAGGKYKGKTGSSTVGTISILCPSTIVDGEIQPDENYLPIVKKQLRASTRDNKQFLTTEDVDFQNQNDRIITVYSVDSNGLPTYFLIQKTVKVVSGFIGKYEQIITTPTPFLKISLPTDQNVLEIISVVDSQGYNWYEVEYLAQDEIFVSEPNMNSSKYTTPLILRKLKVPRRFITETDHNDITSLIFGSSNGSLQSGIVYPDPSKFLVNSLSDNLGFFSFSSNLLLSSGSLGMTPYNTTMTVNYLYGGGTEYNVSAGEITTILGNQLIFPVASSSLDATKYNQVTSSLSITNKEQAQNATDILSVDDIKQLIPIYFAAQKRAVILEDYYSILYGLPSKFGNVHRVLAVNDSSDDKSIALYMLTLDKDKNLIVCSDELKQNIKTFLSKFRMITDNINIYDGEIINFKLDFEIVVKDGYNIYDVVEQCKNELKKIYAIKMQFGESIFISNIISTINAVAGVLTVTNLDVISATGGNYSSVDYDFSSGNIANILSPNFNQLFELKYIDVDITGSAKTF